MMRSTRPCHSYVLKSFRSQIWVGSHTRLSRFETASLQDEAQGQCLAIIAAEVADMLSDYKADPSSLGIEISYVDLQAIAKQASLPIGYMRFCKYGHHRNCHNSWKLTSRRQQACVKQYANQPLQSPAAMATEDVSPIS